MRYSYVSTIVGTTITPSVPLEATSGKKRKVYLMCGCVQPYFALINLSLRRSMKMEMASQRRKRREIRTRRRRSTTVWTCPLFRHHHLLLFPPLHTPMPLSHTNQFKFTLLCLKSLPSGCVVVKHVFCVCIYIYN